MPALPDQLPSPRSTPPGSPFDHSGSHPVNPLLRVSGGLGLAGVSLGLALLALSCAGVDAAFCFSPAVLIFAVIGGILTLISARRSPLIDDSAILLGLFLAALGIIGGLLELAVWQQWSIR
jgi:glucose uptake protein GlcU